jgi:hypothetical protein
MGNYVAKNAFRDKTRGHDERLGRTTLVPSTQKMSGQKSADFCRLCATKVSVASRQRNGA